MKSAIYVLSSLGISSLGIIGICLGSLKWLKIKDETIFSNKIVNEIKILQISDLHNNSTKKMNINIWKKIEELEFDIIVITGDLIIGKLEELTPHLYHIERLAKEFPIFYVDGNHEVYFYKDIKNTFCSYGINVLDNERKTIKINGNIIQMIGFRDFYYLKTEEFVSIDLPFKNLDKNKYTVVLTHQPQLYDKFKKYKPDLVISGHTHGGQLRFPFLPTLFAPFQGFFPKYGDGWVEDGSSKIYISRGIGTTVFPIRFFNRPEIAVITVKEDK